MSLNIDIKVKNKIRAEIIKQLQTAKEINKSNRLKIRKDLLEALLFEEITDKSGVVIKLPVWSGPFLSKIDLSEIDFTNVSWSAIRISHTYGWSSWGFLSEVKGDVKELNTWYPEKTLEISDQGLDYLSYLTKEEITELDKDLTYHNPSDNKSNYHINYEDTNANIDLSKSYEALHHRAISVVNAKISGLDFDDYDFSNTDRIMYYNSRLSGTKSKKTLRIPSDITLDAKISDLSNIDLSDRTINFDYSSYTDFYNCDLKNTGITIILQLFDPESIGETKRIFIEEYIRYLMLNKESKWNGCAVKGYQKTLNAFQRLRAERK